MFALSCLLELWNPCLARLWPGLDVLDPSQYLDLAAVRTVDSFVVVVDFSDT